MSTQTKYIDYLSEDDMIVNQQWVCLSFLSPEGIKNCSMRGIKIRGCYPTRELANERAKQLQDIDPDFHVFVGEVGKWLPWDPDVNTVEENIHANEELNKLAHAYKDNLKKKDKIYHQRTQDLKNNKKSSNDEHNSKNYNEKLEQAKKRMREKLAAKKQELLKTQSNTTDNIVSSDIENIATKELNIEKSENIVKEEHTKLKESEKEINNTKNTISSIDEKLNKMKEIYKNLNK
jgi:DNA repair exonuclease SbcCD ATPase subunit